MPVEPQELPIHAQRLRELLREAGWRPEDLASQSKTSGRTAIDAVKGRHGALSLPIANLYAQALSRKLRRCISASWLQGLDS